MPKSKLQFKRNITDKLSVNGTLSENGTSITYIDKNDMKQEIKISDLLQAFKNQQIELVISLKSNEDLNIITNADN